METKIIEVRDRGTCIICIGIKLRGLSPWQTVAAARAGYGTDADSHEWYVLLGRIDGGSGQLTCDPYEHGGSRTLFEAHRWLRDTQGAWDSLPVDGCVIDVQYLLGEVAEPVKSELYEEWL